MNRIEWLEDMIKKNDELQIITFFENLIWSATDNVMPNTESIKKYLYSKDGYSLNDMYHNN